MQAANQAEKKPIRMFFVMSMGHSGSTLLDLLLGSHSRVQSTGALRHLEKLFDQRETHTCTCGALIKDCPFWTAVTERLAARRAAPLVSIESDAPDEFDRDNYDLVDTIRQVSGKDVLVDSSKNFPRARKLLASGLFDVYVIHLVRDGRAVAHSALTKSGLARKYYRSLIRWPRVNLRNHLKLRNNPRYIMVRYEDLATDPAKTLSAILGKAGLEFEPGQLDFWKGPHHHYAGNRMRFKGQQKIVRSTRYLKETPPWKWATSSLLILPALLFFGYPLTRK